MTAGRVSEGSGELRHHHQGRACEEPELESERDLLEATGCTARRGRRSRVYGEVGPSEERRSQGGGTVSP